MTITTVVRQSIDVAVQVFHASVDSRAPRPGKPGVKKDRKLLTSFRALIASALLLKEAETGLSPPTTLRLFVVG